MGPSQSLKGVHSRAKAQSNAKSLPRKDIKIMGCSNKNPLRITSNFEDTIFEMEALLNEHTKAPESPKALQSIKPPESAKSPESTMPPKGLNAQKSLKASERTRAPKSLKALKSANVLEIPKALGNTKEPEIPKAPEDSKTTEIFMALKSHIPKAQEAAKSPENIMASTSLGASEGAKAAEFVKAPESAMAPTSPKAPESAMAQESSKAPTSLKAPEIPKAPERKQEPENAIAPKSLNAPETPKVPEISKAPMSLKAPEILKTSDILKVNDSEVDIIECTTASDVRFAKDEDPDATEYSSSFGNTTSGAENHSELSETEVESWFCGNSSPEFNLFHYSFPMRKKKLTSHWRNFIRPLMWRCKWTELRIKEIESQALKYSEELAAYDRRKHSYQSVLEDGGSKFLPFSSQHYKGRAMKRRKRKRVEDATDLTSYMLSHNLFSYLEKKRSEPDETLMADDSENPVVTYQDANTNDKLHVSDDEIVFEFRDGDIYLEQVLSKIEVVYSRVHKLKARLETVISQNAGKFYSSENLSLLAPYDPQTSSGHSPAFSVGNGDAISVGAICTQQMSECDIGGPFLPESAVSSYGEPFHVPDIIESTVELLSTTEVTLNQPQIGNSLDSILDSVLMIDDEAVPPEGGRGIIDNTTPSTQPTGQLQEPSLKLEDDAAVVSAPEPQNKLTLEPGSASQLHFPKNKRRRLDRRGGSLGGWRQRQPDDQR